MHPYVVQDADDRGKSCCTFVKPGADPGNVLADAPSRQCYRRFRMFGRTCEDFAPPRLLPWACEMTKTPESCAVHPRVCGEQFNLES